MIYFVTTCLPYVNSTPHVGHSLEFVLGDAISRYLVHKPGVKKVIFNTGLDENGLKIYKLTKELGVDTQVYLDDMSLKWVDFCKKFQISYDVFYRTSSPDHHVKVKEIWNYLLDKGYIYKKSYSGKYCVGCESFKTDQDLKDGKCPDHFTSEPIDIEEENYFFRLSSFKKELIEDLTSERSFHKYNDYFDVKKTGFLQPANKMSELISLIENAEDVSISRLRKNLPWGVEVPNDPEHTIYVWLEALANYVISAGWVDPRVEENKYAYENFKINWYNAVQVCGPDNVRFQGVMFQAMLKALGVKSTTKLLVHGTVLDESGHKMSKSVGNVVDPMEQLEKYGIRAVRYYKLAGLNTFQNSSWSESDLVKLYNSDLANDYGNLLSRVVHLLDRQEININESLIEDSFKEKILNIVSDANVFFDEFEIKQGLQKVNEIYKYCNKYITHQEPWKNKEIAPVVLNNLCWVFMRVSQVYEPFLPNLWFDTVNKITFKNKEPIFPRL